ncbi:MAG: ATP-binding protein [Bellilinea sp.]
MKFPGRYDSLVKIAALVHQATQEFGLDPLASYGVETAVDEACSNIIEHAYGGEGKGEIEFNYRIDEDSLIITLRDNGKGFNPNKIRKPKINVPLKNRQKNGLGLYFMHQWMDEIQFDVIDKANVLTMIKRKG